MLLCLFSTMLHFLTKQTTADGVPAMSATEVTPKARRHRFPVSYKLRILREANGWGRGVGMGFAALVWILSPYATSAQQNQTNQTCLQSDYEILKKFYESTGGGVKWDKQKTWDMNLSPSQVTRNNLSSFEGIYLTSSNGGPHCPSTCVSELNFWAGYFGWGEKMTGTLPPEMGDFCGLTVLELSRQRLTGPIPANLSDNTDLWFVNLSGNRLTGPIPANLGDNTRLYYVDLSDNKLTGTIPLDLLSSEKMVQVNLANNHLAGTIPPDQEFGLYLETLDTGANELEGKIPESVVKSNLDDFDWSDQPACMPDNAKTRSWFNSSNVIGVHGHLCHTWKDQFSEPITLTWDANQYAAYALPRINQPVTVYKYYGPVGYSDDHFTYDVGEANLPAGLQFNPDPPSLSGMPTAEHSQKFRVPYLVMIAKVGTNPYYWVRQRVEVVIEVLVPLDLEDVHAKTLTKGEVIGPEGELPVATGGWPQYTYDLSPKDSLPAGVSFTTAPNAVGIMTGRLQGTPTEAMEPTPFRYTATDREGASLTKEFVLAVRSGFQLQRPAVQIDTVFVEGRAIEDSLRLPEAINGSGDYLYFTEEDLPEGLIQSWSGREIGGTPAGPSDRQEYTYVAYDNVSGDEDSMPYWLTVAPRLAFPDTLLDDSLFTFEVGTPIRPLEFADAIGGLEREVCIWSGSAAGAIGLTWEHRRMGTSTIKGTPTEPWSPVWYTYRVADASSSQVDSLHFGIEVVEAFSLARPTDRYYTVGVPVSDVVAGARGGTSHSYAVDKGLPPGLALDAPAGRIHGTPTGTFPRTKYEWSVTDASLGTKRQDLFLAVDPRLALPDARRYTFTLDERRAEDASGADRGPARLHVCRGRSSRLAGTSMQRRGCWKANRRWPWIGGDTITLRRTRSVAGIRWLCTSERWRHSAWRGGVEDQEYMVGVPASYQFPLCRNCEAGGGHKLCAARSDCSPAGRAHLLRGDPYAQWHADLGHARQVGTTYAVEDRSTNREIGEDFTMVVYDVLRLASRVDTLRYVVGEEIEVYGFPPCYGRSRRRFFVCLFGKVAVRSARSVRTGIRFRPCYARVERYADHAIGVGGVRVQCERPVSWKDWTADSATFVIDVAKDRRSR